MIWEHNVTILVMLTKLKEMGREKCAQYWPADRSLRFGSYLIEPLGEYHMPQYVLNELKLTDSRVRIEERSSRAVKRVLLGRTIENDSTLSLHGLAGARRAEGGRRLH